MKRFVRPFLAFALCSALGAVSFGLSGLYYGLLVGVACALMSIALIKERRIDYSIRLPQIVFTAGHSVILEMENDLYKAQVSVCRDTAAGWQYQLTFGSDNEPPNVGGRWFDGSMLTFPSENTPLVPGAFSQPAEQGPGIGLAPPASGRSGFNSPVPSPSTVLSPHDSDTDADQDGSPTAQSPQRFKKA